MKHKATATPSKQMASLAGKKLADPKSTTAEKKLAADVLANYVPAKGKKKP